MASDQTCGSCRHDYRDGSTQGCRLMDCYGAGYDETIAWAKEHVEPDGTSRGGAPPCPGWLAATSAHETRAAFEALGVVFGEDGFSVRHEGWLSPAGPCSAEQIEAPSRWCAVTGGSVIANSASIEAVLGCIADWMLRVEVSDGE